jgi:hypothetical protein
MFLETSAKNSYNVDEAFQISAQIIMKNQDKNKESEDKKVLYSIKNF